MTAAGAIAVAAADHADAEAMPTTTGGGPATHRRRTER